MLISRLSINLLPAEINNNKPIQTGCDADEGVVNKKEIGKGLESTLEIKSKVKQQPQCRPRRFQKRNKKSNSKVSISCS